MIRPSDSRLFRVVVSTLGEMSGRARPISLKRVVPFSARMHKISIDHFPVRRDRMLRTGQALILVNFFKFSFSGIALIFNISFQEVSVLLTGKILFRMIYFI